MLPDLGLLTMWIEFYTVVAFSLECKLNKQWTRSFSLKNPNSSKVLWKIILLRYSIRRSCSNLCKISFNGRLILKKFVRNIMFINSSVFFSLILLVLSLILL
jgi:hypothetical protein